ncbi:hypothetical protein ACP87_09070 [Pseudomonas oleovorans]|nr:hypothetical protein [Pseudomonas oleovorans]MBN7131471.1 hypothetical protein [Pseudomonas oleovorans]MBN7143010.1 hypothetical protein [Pseudomonas oleovorans]
MGRFSRFRRQFKQRFTYGLGQILQGKHAAIGPGRGHRGEALLTHERHRLPKWRGEQLRLLGKGFDMQHDTLFDTTQRGDRYLSDAPGARRQVQCRLQAQQRQRMLRHGVGAVDEGGRRRREANHRDGRQVLCVMGLQPLTPLRQIDVHRLQALLGQRLAPQGARQVEKRLALHLLIVMLLAEALIHLHRRDTFEQRANVFQHRWNDDQLRL